MKWKGPYAEIWQELLGVERVGIHDNFFELGGDSILTIQVVSRARRLGYELQPKDIFVHQTIARLSRVLDRSFSGTGSSGARCVNGFRRLIAYSAMVPGQRTR